MDDLSRPVSQLPLLLALINLISCSPLVPHSDNLNPTPAPYTAEFREKTMHDRWAGKSYSALVEQLGKPTLVMAIPRHGWPPSSAIHYGINDQQSGCIDSFLVLHGNRNGKQAQVLAYFCR